ncbi:hypothetical protein [Bifidobacterium oedipodis]|uniref:Asp-tRNAAsn/Glu-tRNAGln amidotransferase A subunit n=1 Tax=Bifidobacterium oedipodis TaxID=2675322 RepID=A0A7Y0ESH3_9BIFI|nr:hypothetical protein [Bifidobacterium sp. DSM 109957]NMM94496.1 hypothetical protein [Bifidobacterium sp. DSM 109957]
MSVEEQTTEHEHERDTKRPTRHAVIMRGVVTPIFGLLAVAAIALGLLNATVWKPSHDIDATASVSGSRYIVTDPGVLPLLDKNATLTVNASSSSDEICVALGSSKDVAGWVAADGNSYQRITGLASWSELSTQTGKASSSSSSSSGTQSEPVDFRDSQMWTSVECDKGSVSIDSKNTDDTTMAIIDLGQRNARATVEMHWVRSEVPDFAMPFYLSGGLLAVLAVLSASLFAMPPHKRRHRSVAAEAAGAAVSAAAGTRAADEVPIGVALAGTMRKITPSKRRRHATSHRRSGARPTQNTEVSEALETPTIIDPSARNLVADQQQGAAGTAGADAGAAATAATDTAATTAAGNATDNASSNASDNADRVVQSGHPDNDVESTSVITPDELQAYFARLAQEVGDAGSDTGQENR